MNRIIDFHTHILPGIDDGSRSLKESLAMLAEETRQGVTDIVLTPHFYAFEGSPEAFLSRRDQAWERLKPHLGREPVLRLGAEVHYFEGISKTQGLEKLRVAGTDLLLLEMPMSDWTTRMVEDVIELNSRPGFRVVLAHIDRYLLGVPKKTLDRLLEQGVLLQANVVFFARWQTRFRAMSMVKKGQIHFLGSDCHSMKNRRPNWDTLPEKAACVHEKSFRILRRHGTQA